MSPQTILHFWFETIPQSAWWEKNPAFDSELGQRFGETHRAATQGELAHWREDGHGRLAEIIVLDQFSRNIYRDRPQSFAFDGMALILAQEAHRAGAHHALNSNERAFLFMPFMHSESLAVHEEAVRLFSTSGLESNLDFELRHKAIIERFGRYPHRNAILGRSSTPEETAFLREPGSSF